MGEVTQKVIQRFPPLETEMNPLVGIFMMVVLVWILQILWKRRKLYIYSWKILGPLSFPLIGSAYLFLGNSNDIMDALIKIQKKYSGLAKIWFGPRLVYSLSDPEHIEKVLNKAQNKDELYDFISYVVGTGLMTAKFQKWRKHRKCIMPAFNQKVLDSFVEIFARQSEIFADQLQSYVNERRIDLFLLLSRCTLDIICETAMGIEINTQTSDSDFGTNLDRLMEITTYRIFRLWHHLKFTWRFYPLSKEYEKVINKFRGLTSSVVKKKMEEYRIKQRLARETLTVDTNEDKRNKKLAFLDLILENSSFTEEELREEVDIFMIAGSDTTASAMTCLFTILGMYQDVQQKVLDELLDILGPDRTVLPADLPEMKYTERVIKEALRLFPVAAFFLRDIGEDVDIGDGITLPAGSSAFFGPVHIHRNPKYWKDPLKFDPDRFLPENVAQRHPCTYVAFSYGPRNCIGGRYAMMNMKTILANVLRRYRIFSEYKTIEEIQLKSNIVLRLKDGPKVWFEMR